MIRPPAPLVVSIAGFTAVDPPDSAVSTDLTRPGGIISNCSGAPASAIAVVYSYFHSRFGTPLTIVWIHDGVEVSSKRVILDAAGDGSRTSRITNGGLLPYGAWGVRVENAAGATLAEASVTRRCPIELLGFASFPDPTAPTTPPADVAPPDQLVHVDGGPEWVLAREIRDCGVDQSLAVYWRTQLPAGTPYVVTYLDPDGRLSRLEQVSPGPKGVSPPIWINRPVGGVFLPVANGLHEFRWFDSQSGAELLRAVVRREC